MPRRDLVAPFGAVEHATSGHRIVLERVNTAGAPGRPGLLVHNGRAGTLARRAADPRLEEPDLPAPVFGRVQRAIQPGALLRLLGSGGGRRGHAQPLVDRGVRIEGGGAIGEGHWPDHQAIHATRRPGIE